MGWHLGRMVAFDTETDGPDPTDARIITASVVGVGGGLPVEPRTWIVAPERPIPAEAAAIHGWSTERAEIEGQPRVEAVALIAEAVCDAMLAGHPVVSHNAAYDWTVLAHELARLGLPPLDVILGRRVGPIIDTFVLDKAFDPYRRGSRKLVDAAKHYRVEMGGAHDSTEDALCSARVAYRIAQAFPEVADMDLWGLHDAQVGWAADQAASLKDYFTRTGKTDAAATVDPVWPLRGQS